MRAAGPDPRRRPYLGYRADDGETPFAGFFNPHMSPLAPHVVEALHVGAISAELLLGHRSVPSLLSEWYQPVETGFALSRGGAVRVAVLTPMPRVEPAMWEWWFGWHGCDSRRYKLWHPNAHLFAAWDDGPDDGRTGRARYVGRTSFVDEYLGSTLVRAAIRFVPPAAVGLDEAALAEGGDQIAVCARVGASDRPVDVGHLVHHVRRTDDGCEMRSRFFIGGHDVAARAEGPMARGPGTALARRMFGHVARPSATSAAELLVHCAQEMAHLASFLPELYAQFGGE